MTLFQLYTEGVRELSHAGNPDAEVDARQLLLAAFHLDAVHYLLNRMQEMEDGEDCAACTDTYRSMIAKRIDHIPVQQILGSQEFMGLTFFVNEHVLIPRQDTETLVELVLEEQQDVSKRVLDLCTGSGCIAISLAVKGGYTDVTATDISDEALEVARKNAAALLTNGQEPARLVAQTIEFLQGDLFEALGDGQHRFDIITSNPPYIPSGVIDTLEPEVREHEPILALDGTADGLYYYRKLAAEAGGYLNRGGAVYAEIGYDQGAAVRRLFEEAGFVQVRVCRDLPGKDRVVCAVWPGMPD